MDTTLYDVFNNWIDSSNSENTKTQYGRIVPNFFEMVTDKEIQFVTEEDIMALKPMTIDKKYKNVLLKNGYKQSTVISYLTIISSFFKQLDINGIFPKINYMWVKEKLLSYSRLKDDSESRKNMSYAAYVKLKKWLKEKEFSDRYKDNGKKYAYVLEFMWVTASRIDAVFKVKWSDISFEEDGLGQKGYTIYIHDKGGKINKKPISNEFYYQLEDILYNENLNDPIFKGLGKRSFTQYVKEFCEETGYDFTPHSIKRGAVTQVYHLTHDLVVAQKFADHEDPKTTLRYIQDNPDRTSQGSYILSTDFSLDELDRLSKEQLLSIIKNRKDLSYMVVQEAHKQNIK